MDGGARKDGGGVLVERGRGRVGGDGWRRCDEGCLVLGRRGGEEVAEGGRRIEEGGGVAEVEKGGIGGGIMEG